MTMMNIARDMVIKVPHLFIISSSLLILGGKGYLQIDTDEGFNLPKLS